MAHRLPDIVIIGAMKSGTTSLYQYLVSHPQVVGGRRKEPSFFDDMHWEKGIEWYAGLFPNNDKLKCEASTNYTKHPKYGPVAQRMHGILPDAKLIYLVRHPVDRAISQLHHMTISRGRKTSIITRENLKKENKSAIRLSKYHYQISQFLEYYDPTQIKILRFEDLIAQPVQVMQELSRFLGIDDAYYTTDFDFKRHNKLGTSAIVKYKKLYLLLSKANAYKLLPPVQKLLETPVPRPQLTAEAKQAIWDEVAEDLSQFEALIGHSLDYKPPA